MSEAGIQRFSVDGLHIGDGLNQLQGILTGQPEAS